MIRILKVESENFRSYAELSFEMPQNGVRLIDGENRATGGSNGSGKTTACDLIVWALYGYIPRGGLADNVIRWGQKSCWARITLQVDQDTWAIERRRPNKLLLQINGDQEKLAEKEIQAKIDQKIMPAERFLLASYIAQKRDQSFFSMNDSARTKLLSILANTEQLDNAAQKAKAEQDESLLKVKMAQSQQQALDAERLSCSIRIDELKQQIQLAAEQIEPLRIKKEAAEEEHKIKSFTLREEAQIKLLELEKQLVAQIVPLDERSVELSAHVQKLEAALASYKAYVPAELAQAAQQAQDVYRIAEQENRKIEDTKARNRRYQEQIQQKEKNAAEIMEHGSCRECNQLLPEKARNDAAQKLLGEAEFYRRQIQPETDPFDLAALAAARDHAGQALAKAKQESDAEPSRIKLQIRELQTDLRGLQTQKQQLQTSTQVRKAEIDRHLDQQLRQFDQAKQQAAAEYERAAEQSRRSQAILQEKEQQLAGLAVKLEDLKNQAESHQHDAVVKSELQQAIKGTKACEFDGLVARIGETANQYLERLLEGYGTSLSQLKENGKGEARLVLRPVLTRNGEEITLDMLSGGMADRVTLCYDLAINQIASEGLPLFLDEAASAIDSNGKFELLALLQEIAKDRAVFIIDHDSVLISAISDVWTVTKQNDTSVLEVA